MPFDSTNLDVTRDTWTEVAAGPAGILITATDNFNYAYAPIAPVGILGHFALGNVDQLLRPSSGQSLWIYNPLRNFRATVTIEGML